MNKGEKALSINGVFSVCQKDVRGNVIDWSVAINPTVDRKLQRVTWHDKGRGRVIDYSQKNDLNMLSTSDRGSGEVGKIEVKDSRNQMSYTLEPLSLAVYNESIKGRISKHPNFNTKEEMLAFFQSDQS